MILKTKLPSTSILNSLEKKYDYVDSYLGMLSDNNNSIDSTDLGKAFFSSSPKWIEKLFIVRNKIVSIFGLKTSGKIIDRQKQLENFKCEVGEQLGLFKVFHKSNYEVVLGEDDKHLNFRVSLLLNKNLSDSIKKDLIISTTVEFNNKLGRFYFLTIRPFHKFIVPSMLNAIIKELEQRNG